MFKKIVVTSLLFTLTACDVNKEPVLTEELVVNILNEKINNDCYYATFDLAPNIQFNTTLRYWDENKKSMINDPNRTIISIPADSADAKKARVSVLEKIGMLEKTKDSVFVGVRGVQGYYVDAISYKENEKDEEFIEKTREDHGGQYRLTEKGLASTFKPDKGSDILLCLGKIRVDKFKIHPLNEAGVGRTKVTFTTKVIDVPDWLKDKDVNLVFPKLITESKNAASKTRGAIYIILNNRKEFIIEDDFVFHY